MPLSRRDKSRRLLFLIYSLLSISSHRSYFIVPLLLLVSIGCDNGKPPHAAPAVDTMARRFLRTVASGDLDSIRRPLSAEGKEVVTSLSMARTLAHFEAGPPTDVTLVDAEVADSYSPTPAERHRLTYKLLMPDNRSYYYFFELMIERRGGAGDSTITGFRIEPHDGAASDSSASDSLAR